VNEIEPETPPSPPDRPATPGSIPADRTPDPATRNVFRIIAVVIGVVMAGAALLINWTVGKLLS
jgi:hypothetical protein